MAVFQAAADESDGPRQRGPFIYGGFVAPVTEWNTTFSPAWEERVLNAEPPIPHLHMVDMRNPKWREKFGMTRKQAETRIEEAARVIGSTGSLGPLVTEFDGGHFRDVFGETKLARLEPQVKTYQFEPDYVGFLGFAYAALEYVAINHPNAERVDFMVEQKTTVSRHLETFVRTLAEGLTAKGRPELVRLIGTLICGGKDRLPLQAADVAVWHLRRESCGDANSTDRRRLGLMFNGRQMMTNGMSLHDITEMGIRSKAHAASNPFPK